MALQSPESVANLVAVDNAPVDAALRSNFAHYIRGMKKVDSAGVTRQSEAEEILREYEEASWDARTHPPPLHDRTVTMLTFPLCPCVTVVIAHTAISTRESLP